MLGRFSELSPVNALGTRANVTRKVSRSARRTIDGVQRTIRGTTEVIAVNQALWLFGLIHKDEIHSG